MNVSLGERWEKFVEQTVREGRYGSASEVVREGLRLVEEREARLNALRDHLNASIVAGGDSDDDELDAALAEEVKALSAKGF
jgi:antitoxin ParD1/3/4